MGGRGAALKALWQTQLQRCRICFTSRRAMSSKLFVGGLSFTTEEDGLRNAFSRHGEVVDVRIVMDRESGRSRGFGFVTFMTEDEAGTAKDKMNGQFLDGRVIRVDRATPRPGPPPPPPRSTISAQEDQADPQDWGTIPSPIAAVPQNASIVQSPGAVASSELPSLSSLASSASPPPIDGSVAASPSPLPPPPAPSPPVEPTKPTFNFNFDFSAPDPTFVPRPRPPRLRPSMMDFEFGFFSDTSKFPFNTNFGTGFLRVRGPEAEFDFSDIKEALALKKAAELAAKQEAEAAAAASAKKAEEAAAAAVKEANETAAKQAEEAVAAAMNSSPAGEKCGEPEPIHIQQKEEAAIAREGVENVHPIVEVSITSAITNAPQNQEEAAAEKELKDSISIISASASGRADVPTKQDASLERESDATTPVVVLSSKPDLMETDPYPSSATPSTLSMGVSDTRLKQEVLVDKTDFQDGAPIDKSSATPNCLQMNSSSISLTSSVSTPALVTVNATQKQVVAVMEKESLEARTDVGLSVSTDHSQPELLNDSQHHLSSPTFSVEAAESAESDSQPFVEGDAEHADTSELKQAGL